MSKPIIIANWKMNLSVAQSGELARIMKKSLADAADSEVVVCPSFTALAEVSREIRGSIIRLGSQDVFWEERGAYTGEESPQTLTEIGCQYAIIGHSERRQYAGESDESSRLKIKTCLANGLNPILCVGETYAERNQGQADNVVFRQVVRALSGIDITPNQQLVIAYEPVWVIGSGRPIEPKEAQHAFNLIYQAILDFWPSVIIKNNVRIIYGGSVDGGNAGEFAPLEHFAGFLVGGASLKSDEFSDIIKQIR